jgi:hypothetical protein
LFGQRSGYAIPSVVHPETGKIYQGVAVVKYLILLSFSLILIVSPAPSLTSKDAYVIRKGDAWTLGTAKVERTLRLADGKFVTSTWEDKTSGRELLPVGTVSDELGAMIDGQPVLGGSGGWKLLDAKERTLTQGEIQVDLTLQRDNLEATKSYVVYPGSSIIREWVSFKNAGTGPLRVSEPGFLDLTTKPGPPESVDFHWMTGGTNEPGSWTLKTEKLKAGKIREFNSYDPFGGTAEGNFLGDGVMAKVLVNDRQVWPALDGHDENWAAVSYGWIDVANSTVRVPLRTTVDVVAGDKVRFILNRNDSAAKDTTAFDPTITYGDHKAHTASKEFSAEQGKDGWWYQYADEGEIYDPKAGEFLNLAYSDASQRWTKPGEQKQDSLFIGAGEMHPGKEDVALVWVAAQAGRVKITADLTNIGNPPVRGAGRRIQMGSSSYAPWNAVMSRETGEGVFIGWDYFGHWASAFTLAENGAMNARFRVAGYDKTLKPGESLTTPRAFVGLYQKDLDEAGNECLDWQYAYLWDYTRAGWFPAIRMLGWWWKGTPWKDPSNTWYGGNGDAASTFRKVFRVADLMQEVGADVYHRDWGWWDHAGDWNGPDFKTMGGYLRKYGMGELIYAFIYTVDPKSKVAREHPDWVVGDTLDMSKPQVVEFLKNQLDEFRERFGPFEWRNDSTPTVPNGGDTPLLGQDQGFREILRSFLDKHPDSAFQAVNGGGNDTGYDYARYASTVSFSDGAVGILRNQWASLLLPPDKTSDIPDIWQPGQYDKALWRGLLTINFDMTGDTWDPQKLEGLRELIDIYHYLGSQGVVGRWVHVYRPQVTGDEPAMYFERLSRDGGRGIIIPKRTAIGPVTISPKGLHPRESYFVSFQESQASATRTGADLMANGIKLEKMEPGELIYLNLPYHPGNRLDKAPPTPPRDLRKALAANMGYPGVELTWKPGQDDHWLSYYEVLRNNQVLDKVAKGTFYFDHSAGADVAATYQIRSVDGAGLRSGLASAAGPARKPARILDDAQTAISFAGKWQRETHLQPAHEGTISRSDETGASFSFGFDGTKFTWFTKLGGDCGKAEISIDGQREAVVDTYSADDIWGVGVYSRTFPAAGKHTVKITVLGEHGGPRGKGTFVYVDGVRIEGAE